VTLRIKRFRVLSGWDACSSGYLAYDDGLSSASFNTPRTACIPTPPGGFLLHQRSPPRIQEFRAEEDSRKARECRSHAAETANYESKARMAAPRAKWESIAALPIGTN
jgi:hypothetical protein